MSRKLKPLSLYVHIPFCKAKCTYCDFYSVVGRESSIPNYLQQILKEIDSYEHNLDLSGHQLDTIFLGGGTPNLLNPSQMERLLERLLRLAAYGGQMEIGMEINPGEATLENLKAYRGLGINRVSIGMQSFQKEHLTFMSRIHSVEQSFSTYAAVRQAGFDNVNADMIFAIPGQTREQWVADLQTLSDMKPEHISTYSLTVEEGTALSRWVAAGHVKMLEDTVDTGMYDWGRDFLESQGYLNYEISNHARPGFQCKHNLNYWLGADYLGFGPAAHSYFQSRRWWNVRNLDRYLTEIESRGTAEAGSEVIDTETARNEWILTRLRLAQGLDLEAFSRRFNEDLLMSEKQPLKKWDRELEIVEGKLRLSRKGWALADEISSYLMK